MMREIKFRAWDKVLGMRPVVLVDWNNQASWVVMDEAQQYELSFANSPLMQYTGLKDKNGKDIYEGDVLKNPEVGDIGPVVWDVDLDYGPSFIWQHTKMYSCQLDECEVIGNIYENGELLCK